MIPRSQLFVHILLITPWALQKGYIKSCKKILYENILFQRLTEIELQIGPDDDGDDTSDDVTPVHGNGLIDSGNSGEDEADNNKESFI